MKEIFEKISSYNFFNYLLPGVLFVFLLKEFNIYSFNQEDIIIGFFVYYFIGLIISRIGSLVIEPVAKKIKFIEFCDYKEYVVASKNDPKIELFSEINNMYRTLCSMILVFLILTLIINLTNKSIIHQTMYHYLYLIIIFFILLFSYRKQTEFIKKRIIAQK